MIIYVHGFGSNGQTEKSKILRKSFKGIEVVSPSLPLEPNAAIAQLTGIIKNANQPLLLVGSSLGAFYSTYLASLYDLHCVLINPPTAPWETIPTFDPSYPDKFRKQLKVLDKRQKKADPLDSIFHVYLAKDDDHLDYKKAVKKYHLANVTVTSGGGHRYTEEFKKLIPKIQELYKSLDAFREENLHESEDIFL